MSFRHFRLVFKFALGFSIVFCAGSVAAESSTLFGSGAVVDAGWIQSDDCRQTLISVVYIEGVTREPGGPVESQDRLIVNVTMFDFCTGAFISTNSEGTAELSLKNGLNDARLIGTAVGQTLPTGTAAEFAVDLTFIASGGVLRDFILQRFTVGNSFRSSSKVDSRIREAVATGSVRLNGLELISGPSEEGSLQTRSSVTFERSF